MYYIDYTSSLTGDVIEVYQTYQFRGAPRSHVYTEIFHINVVTGETYTMSDLINDVELRKKFILRYKEEMKYLSALLECDLGSSDILDNVEISITESNVTILTPGTGIKTEKRISWDELKAIC